MSTIFKNTLVKNIVLRAWNISDIPNIYLWLDASDSSTITLNGSNVSQWDDKSGNSRHFTQTTGGFQPEYILNSINGKNIVRSDGANKFMSLANQPAAQNMTFFIVQRYNGSLALSATGNHLFSWANSLGGGDQEWWFYVSSFVVKGVFAIYRLNVVPPAFNITSGNNITNGSPHITTLSIDDEPADAGIATAYADSVPVKQILTAPSYTPHSKNMYLFAAPTGTVREYSGDFCEIIMYDRLLKTAERQQVESYLTTKWGI